MNSKDISRKFVEEILEEKLTAFGMLNSNECISITGSVEFKIVPKVEEVYTIIDHGEESYKKL